MSGPEVAAADAPPFDFDAAIRSAAQQMDREVIVHDKRMEFWTGYKTAMEEVKSHWGGHK